MAKAIFEVSGTSDSLKPLVSGTRSSNDMRNALGALHQTDFAPIRARAQGFNSLSLFVNPAVVEGFYMPVLNISGVPCTYPSGQSPTTYTPASNNRIDILHVNAAEPSPTLYWVSGTSAASPTIPSISTSGTPVCAVYHRAASTKILQTDDASNSYIYRDMRPLYSYSQPYTRPAAVVGTATGSTDITTASASYIDMTDMSITLTTTGRPVRLDFVSAMTGSAQGVETWVVFLVNGNNRAPVRIQQEQTSEYGEMISTTWIESGLAAGTYTFKVQWKSASGTSKQYGASTTPRVFLAQEL